MNNDTTRAQGEDARRVYVGVDLANERVTVITRLPDIVRDVYLIPAEHAGDGQDGLIFLDTSDQTFNGIKARKIALAETESGRPIGLGWRFAIRLSDEWGRS